MNNEGLEFKELDGRLQDFLDTFDQSWLTHHGLHLYEYTGSVLAGNRKKLYTVITKDEEVVVYPEQKLIYKGNGLWEINKYSN